MSTFGGKLKELENILVDNFLLYESHTCFFLSHCHSDHMLGLQKLFSNISEESNHYIYCSPISHLILLNRYKIDNKELIRELTSPSVITVPENELAPSYQVIVTPIPAGHCPGSIMFLFETKNKAILYTGDFRILKNDLSKFKSFHNMNQIKLIDKLYFDSTFLNDVYWDFPLRSEVVAQLMNLIKDWISKSPRHNVLLKMSASYGYEFVLAELGRNLKCKIHVKDFLFDIFWNIPEVGCFLTKDCNNTKLHAFSIFDKKCDVRNCENLLQIKLSAQWYKSAKGAPKQAIWKKVSHKNIILCYATHSSCSELVSFINYLKPKSLEPCTAAVGSTEESTKAYAQQITSSWGPNKMEDRKKSTETDFRLEKNYKFNLKFPEFKTLDFEDSVEFSTEKKKKISEADVLV